MALGSTQLLPEIYNGDLPWGGGLRRPAHTTENLATFVCRLKILGAATSWSPRGPPMTVEG
jgi:hypothetical protein